MKHFDKDILNVTFQMISRIFPSMHHPMRQKDVRIFKQDQIYLDILPRERQL